MCDSQRILSREANHTEATAQAMWIPQSPELVHRANALDQTAPLAQSCPRKAAVLVNESVGPNGPLQGGSCNRNVDVWFSACSGGLLICSCS